jgi:hypothetical protein
LTFWPHARNENGRRRRHDGNGRATTDRQENESLVKGYLRVRIREALLGRRLKREQRLAEQSIRMAASWQHDLRAGNRDW